MTHDTTIHYAVVQIGGPIYGIGATPEAALADAQDWADPFEPVPRRQAVDGDMVVLPCTPRLAAYVRTYGTPAAWDDSGALLDVLDEEADDEK